MADYEDFDVDDRSERPPDPQQARVREILGAFFEEHRAQVFFSRQIEVQHEDRYFRWVADRALRELVEGVSFAAKPGRSGAGGQSSWCGTGAIVSTSAVPRG